MWIGACIYCGHCGCYAGAGGPAKWYPGIGGSKMKWGKRYPAEDLEICSLIRDAFLVKFSYEWDDDYDFDVTIRIVGGGAPLDVDCHVTEKGIQKSASDSSCPFFVVGAPNECIIWNRSPFFPPSCANNPQTFTDLEQITRWGINHPTCGWTWSV